jgi:hypothetical protein
LTVRGLETKLPPIKSESRPTMPTTIELGGGRRERPFSVSVDRIIPVEISRETHPWCARPQFV